MMMNRIKKKHMKTNPIIEFYKNSGFPYYIDDILIKWDNNDWECHHDFIQWLFPNSRPSNFNGNAPVLDKNTASILRNNFFNKINLALLSFDDYLHNGNYLNHSNHNHLRISRTLCFLIEIDLKPFAHDYLNLWLSPKTPAESANYWKNIINNTQSLI